MNHPGYFVAVFGGAVAGAEAALQLSRRGIYTAVFEQNAFPYGKIEDGLPKWHVKLRNKEEEKIDEKLKQPYVFFVPKVKLGRDIDFEDVTKNWGFSAVLVATGAWKDRPLTIAGIDDYIGRGFYYQNPFVAWFNHNHEPDYDGPHLETYDDAIVVGGGLASLDVVKILM
ncbi:MAG: FAD-dependent oxidoreductase, partial [Nitrososphaera sp.]